MRWGFESLIPDQCRNVGLVHVSESHPRLSVSRWLLSPDVAQLVDAIGLNPIFREFDSHRPDQIVVGCSCTEGRDDKKETNGAHPVSMVG
jgi:hypothetical protein